MSNIISIKNDFLTVQVNTMGAQMWSVKDSEDTEYLWQGDIRYWEDKSPVLFPYIARLTEGKYLLDEKEYEMDIHGFAKDSLFQVEKHTECEVVLCLTDSEKTYVQYPWHFIFKVEYKLVGKKIEITFHVENKDTKTMYYGVGGHPGFRVPLQSKETFEDYYLEFLGEGQIKRELFSVDCFVLGKTEEFLTEKGMRLPLRHDLFDEDAIVLRDMPKAIALKSKKQTKGVQLSYLDMDYLGLWHAPKTDAPYICIEPWSSLPSRKNVIENLSEQESLKKVEAGNIVRHCWAIELLV